MKRIILSGCNGGMGRIITAVVKTRDDCNIVAGIDSQVEPLDAFPVFSSPGECAVQADVIIDFSHPTALSAILEYAVKHHIPAVIATTGLSAEQIKEIHDRSNEVALFFTANMSIGVNLLAGLARRAAAVLGGQFDIEIIEKHHNRKIDAPSGTALMLADIISETLETPPQYVYDRHAVRKKRGRDEIGIHSVRGGTIVGEHEIIFAGHDEVLTLSHTATSREVFATGSINAAMFVCGKESGLYDMSDIV